MTKRSLYKSICSNTPGVPLFMQPWWLDAVSPGWDAAVAKKGDMVTGLWAYPVEQKLGVDMLRTPLLTPYLGPHVFYPHDLKESKLDSFEYEAVSELIKQLPAARVWHLAIQPGIKQVGLFRQHGLKPQVQQTFLLDLSGDEASLLANMKESVRRNIKAAEKEITVTTSADHLQELFQFHRATLSRKDKAVSYTLADARRVFDACRAHNACTLWVAKEGDAVQAIVWQVWDDNCSYYLMGGQSPAAGSYKAMTALLWHAIKDAKKRGHRIFDFEGSMDEGVERFFRNFGGEKALYMVLHKNDSLIWKAKKMVMG